MGTLLTLTLFGIRRAVREFVSFLRMLFVFGLSIFGAIVLIYSGLFLAACWITRSIEHDSFTVTDLTLWSLVWLGIVYLVLRRGINALISFALWD